MMPMILTQTMCKELCVKTWFGDSFRRVMKTCVAAEVGGMLQRFTIIDVSNNVYTSVFPLIISDFMQI